MKRIFPGGRIDPILKRSPCLQVHNPLPRSDFSIPLLPFETSNDGGFALLRNNGMQLISGSNFPVVPAHKDSNIPLSNY